MKHDNITVVICCAGMGTRLGIGTTKALVKICGKSIIQRQLEMLSEYDDIRIVVGYQAERVIELVNNIRKDIMFAFNYDYKTTGPAASFSKALVHTRKYVVVLDGDMLINEDDFKNFMNISGEVIGISKKHSDEPVYVSLNSANQVISFENEIGDMEWSGIAKLESKHLRVHTEHIFNMIKPLLPIKSYLIRAREVDTPDDYDRMVEWVEQGYYD